MMQRFIHCTNVLDFHVSKFPVKGVWKIGSKWKEWLLAMQGWSWLPHCALRAKPLNMKWKIAEERVANSYLQWDEVDRLIVHSLIISREGLILTLSILPCLEGWISWSIRGPVDELMMRRMPVFHQNSVGIGKSISRNLVGVGDGFPNTSLVLVEHGHNPP